MRLGNKSAVLAPDEFATVAHNLSKSALIDLVWDLMVRGEGEDVMTADPATACAKLAEAFAPIAVAREDQPLDPDKILRRAAGMGQG